MLNEIALGEIFPGLNQVNLQTERGRGQLAVAIREFHKRTESARNFLHKRNIREFSSSDFPEDVQRQIRLYSVGMPDVDREYEIMFGPVDMSGVTSPNFTLRNVQNLLTFKKVVEGEKAKVYNVVGSEATLYYDTYAAGLEIPSEWLDDHAWYDIARAVVDGRLAWYRDKADIFYALIEALTDKQFGTDEGVNIPYTTSGTGTLEKDVITICDAVESLITNLTTSGFGVTAKSSFTLLTTLTMARRVRAALDIRVGQGSYTGNVVPYNITLAVTNDLNTSAQFYKGTGSTQTTGTAPALGYLAVPGRNNLNITRQNLIFHPSRRIDQTRAWTQFADGRYVGCLDYRQCRRLLSIV